MFCIDPATLNIFIYSCKMQGEKILMELFRTSDVSDIQEQQVDTDGGKQP